MKINRNYNIKKCDTKMYLVQGDEYSISYQVGKIFKKSLSHHVNDLKKEFFSDNANVKYVNRMKQLLQKRYPAVFEAVKGRANGAKVDLDLYMYYLCAEYKNQQAEKCSSIIDNTKNNKFIMHNEDEDCDKYNTKLIKYKFNNNLKCIEIAYADSLEGTACHYGSNFVFTMNYIHVNKYNLQYLPMHFYNKLLANAKSSQEFFEIIKTLPIASATGFNFYDFKEQKFYYIEKVFDEYNIKEINGINLHTNHFTSQEFVKYNPKHLATTSNTFNRLLIAKQLVGNAKDLTINQAKNILTYYGSCDYNSVMSKKNCGYDSLTFGAFLFDPVNKIAEFNVHNKKHDKLQFNLDF